MRRPECTVKSNVTRHSWHTASPPRKTSQRCIGLGLRHPEDVCRNISTSKRERERKKDTCIPDPYCSILHTSRLSFLCKQFSRSFYACALIRRRRDLCAVLHLSILRNQFSGYLFTPLFDKVRAAIDRMGLSWWDYIVKFADETTVEKYHQKQISRRLPKPKF